MPATITYEPNHRDFRLLMLSNQIIDLVMDAANRGVQLARIDAERAGLPTEYIATIHSEHGPIVTLGKRRNPRPTGRMVADHPLSAVFEFGSGVTNTGGAGGRPRPQGGYSEPYRILGHAAHRIASPGGGPR